MQFENTIAENVEAVVCVEAKMSGTLSSILNVTADMLIWYCIGIEAMENISYSKLLVVRVFI